ncbi:MAG: glycoside hydrolase, partial [Nitrospirae bacterium]
PPDRFLRHVAQEPWEMDQAARDFALHNFFAANQERQILPSPRYAELYQRARGRGSRGASPLAPQDLLDLQVWFLLAWCGAWLRQEDPLVAALLAKGRGFSQEEKMALLARMQEVAGEVVPRYRALAEAGRIELSFTPYYHPILPLLCDTLVGRESNPATHLPQRRLRRPGDAVAQVERGLARHAEAFGAEPAGCWPAEGGLSQEAVEILAAAGRRWAAGDEAVLLASLGRPPRAAEEVLPEVYRLWSAPGEAASLTLAFRDRELSDRIGFTYSRWETERAVADLVGRLARIREGLAGRAERPVVSLILDGENAWEFYPENGRPFLLRLYEALAATEGLVPRTVSGAVEAGCDRGELGRLHPGSWIHGNFDIWIGHPEKNLAWDWVARAAQEVETAAGVDEGARREAYTALLAAEGSDWFWWYGDDHYSAHDHLFDHLFRAHV